MSYASGRESTANAGNAAAVLPECQLVLSDSSTCVQPGASIDCLVLSNVSTASKHQTAASREGRSELSAEPSIKPLH